MGKCLTFARIATNFTAVMRRLVGPNRILCLLLLAVSLHAVWPASNYNSRLELFNPSTAPSDIQLSNPVSRAVRVTHARLVANEASAISSRAHGRQSQIVHAAIPIYQKRLTAADNSRIVEDRYASSLYSSCSVPRASGRGPPRSIA